MSKFTPEELGLEETLCFGVPFSDGTVTLVPVEQPYARALQWKAAYFNMTTPQYVVSVLLRAQLDPSSPQNVEDYPVPEFLRNAHRDCQSTCGELMQKMWPLLIAALCMTLLLSDLYDYIQ